MDVISIFSTVISRKTILLFNECSNFISCLLNFPRQIMPSTSQSTLQWFSSKQEIEDNYYFLMRQGIEDYCSKNNISIVRTSGNIVPSSSCSMPPIKPTVLWPKSYRYLIASDTA